MGRLSWIGLAVVAGTLACPLSAGALAASFAWQLPTSSEPGTSNPGHDTYGATPWTYVEAANASSPGPPPLAPTSFQPLGTYSTSIDGSLSGWEDLTDPDQPFVAVNRTSGTVTGNDGLQIPAGQLALQPASDRVVGIGWTSPLSSSETVSVSGTVVPDAQTSSCPGSQPSWVLERGGLVLASEPPPGSGQPAGPQPFSATATLAPGDTIYLVLGWYGVPAGFNRACTTAGVTLSVQAPATPPTVSLSAPSSGSTITNAQPKFTGDSSNGFGDANTVSVRVWRGSSATGNPLETVTADGTSGHYSAAPNPPLTSGTYTAQAEQDDLAGDTSFSAPVTFKVHNDAPRVALAPLPKRPQTTATPQLAGTAGTATGDATAVTVGIWEGTAITGKPIRERSATRAANGRWSLRVTPGLSDGRYTAVALQQGPGGIYGVSKPATFRVKSQPPAVGLDQPAAGASLKPGPVTASGTAGTALGDDPHVTVAVYKGRATGGEPVASARVRVRGGTWSRQLPGLAPGAYTVVAQQRDDAGHLAIRIHQFTLLAPPQVIAASPALDRSDHAEIAITCTASTGSCTGDVLVVTERDMRTTPDGPSGHVRVLFGYVEVPAGHTLIVRRPVPSYVAAALRRSAPVQVQVTVKLRDSGGHPITASIVTVLRLTP